MTPKEDAFKIWESASRDGIYKYLCGSIEHKTQFWQAGAAWYAKNLRDEQLDLISYLHHLIERINLIQLLVAMMEDEEISMKDAAKCLRNLCSDEPPQSL
jgi:hypothetical protein